MAAFPARSPSLLPIKKEISQPEGSPLADTGYPTGHSFPELLGCAVRPQSTRDAHKPALEGFPCSQRGGVLGAGWGAGAHMYSCDKPCEVPRQTDRQTAIEGGGI